MLDLIFMYVIFFTILVITIRGAVYIVSIGFLRLIIGAIIVSILLSLTLSSLANVILVSTSCSTKRYSQGDGARDDSLPYHLLVFLQYALFALAQPTLSGILMLAIIIFLAMAASQLTYLIEEIQVLTDCHTAFADRPRQDLAQLVRNTKVK
ncbi:unnamed protein product [Phytomonas sp. EM1]|nr:unnamed protein product [Phytomonas sp. EM1]|eukprot:CCW61178.1 unnamed protein product [Phytomonas sp. isolate EM1]